MKFTAPARPAFNYAISIVVNGTVLPFTRNRTKQVLSPRKAVFGDQILFALEMLLCRLALLGESLRTREIFFMSMVQMTSKYFVPS